MDLVKKNFFGTDCRFHHIGIVADDLKKLNKKKSEIIVDQIQKVKIAFIKINGCLLEVLSPLDKGSPIQNSLSKGNKIVHICFEVRDINDALKRARNNKFLVISRPIKTKAFAGRQIAWVYSNIFGLFELLEK